MAKNIAKRFRESGTILYLKSMTDKAKSIKKLSPIKRAGKVKVNLLASVKNIKPDKISIIGYCTDIFVLQNEHLPPKKIQDSIGMLCQGFSGVLQDVQCEETKTTLSSFGILSMTTFKNEPIKVPKTKAISISTT